MNPITRFIAAVVLGLFAALAGQVSAQVHGNAPSQAGTAFLRSGTIAGSSITNANAAGGIPIVLGKSFAQVTAPADTNEDILATVTVPANAMGANGVLRIRCQFAYTNNANSKTLRVRWSGASGTQFINLGRSTNLSSTFDFVIGNQNATNSQRSLVSIEMQGAGAATYPASVTAAIDTTAATTILFTGQKGTAGDTLTLDGYLVELMANGQ